MTDGPRRSGPRRPPGRGAGASPTPTPRRPTSRPTPATKKGPGTKKAAAKSRNDQTGKSTGKKPTASAGPRDRPAKSSNPNGASAKRATPTAPGPRVAKSKPGPKAPVGPKGPSTARVGTGQSPVAAESADRRTKANATTKTETTAKTARTGSAFDSGVVARIRSERSPRTGWESITGSTRAVVIEPEEVLPPPPTPATAFRQRYGVVYNTQGPRIRLGVLWLLAVVLSLAFSPLRPYGLAVLYGVAAGLAAQQVMDAWHHERTGNLRWVVALGASALPVLATTGTQPLGVGLLLLVVTSVVVAITDGAEARELPVMAEAGTGVLAAGMCGGAAAALVLLANYDIGAVIILLLYLMIYDACDYVVGSGASNGVEGPLAGGLFIAAASMLLAVTEVPPFRGADVWNFAMLAAVACPAGQLLASAMLPRADAFAPALRRLDSLLIVGPAWAGLIGLYLQQTS